MPELILSDITVMGPGYCVIGLEALGPNRFRSVRPMPPFGYAWREPFLLRRGEYVKFDCQSIPCIRPHIEDVRSFDLSSTRRSLNENDLIDCLRKAEFSKDLEQLFGCAVQSSTGGGRALWVSPSEAARSVCGCEYVNLRFRLFPEPQGFNLRAELTLNSNERVPSIPIVDREWRRFANQLFQRIRQKSDALLLVEHFLNGKIRNELMANMQRFARIGLPRPREDKQCWLMLDSLFPQPSDSWLELH